MVSLKTGHFIFFTLKIRGHDFNTIYYFKVIPYYRFMLHLGNSFCSCHRSGTGKNVRSFMLPGNI